MLSTPWAWAMLAMLPLFAAMRAVNGHWPWHRLRTWAALWAACAIGWAVTPVNGATPFLAYLLICAGAGLVTVVHPAGLAQRAITAIFGCMAAFHGGAALAGEPNGGPVYHAMLAYGGWAQAAILAGWSMADGGLGALVHRGIGHIRGSAPHNHSHGGRPR